MSSAASILNASEIKMSRQQPPASSASATQVEVQFMTDLDGDKFQFPAGFVSGGIMIPGHLTRRGLSEIINTLLELEAPIAFDFLVTLPSPQHLDPSAFQDDGLSVLSRRVFLRTSLAKFMKRNNISSEMRLTLYYVVARSVFDSSNLLSTEDWVIGLSSCRTSESSITIAAASADGSCRISHVNLPSDASLPVPDEPFGVVSRHHLSVSPLTSIHLESGLSHNESLTKVIATNQSGELIIGYCPALQGKDENTVRVVAKGKSSYGSLISTALANDGSLLGTGGSTGTIYVWDNRSDAGEWVTTSREGVREDGLTGTSAKCGVASRGSKKRCRVEEPSLQALTPTGVLEGHSGPVTGLQTSARRWPFNLFSCSLDQTIRVWDTLSQAPICTWACTRAATSITLSPEGSSFSTSHDDGRVRVWDIRDGSMTSGTELLSRITSTSRAPLNTSYYIHRRVVSHVQWNPKDEYLLASVSQDGSLKILDIRAPGMAAQVVTFPDVKLLCVHWIDRNRCMTGGSDYQVRCHYSA